MKQDGGRRRRRIKTGRRTSGRTHGGHDGRCRKDETEHEGNLTWTRHTMQQSLPFACAHAMNEKRPLLFLKTTPFWHNSTRQTPTCTVLYRARLYDGIFLYYLFQAVILKYSCPREAECGRGPRAAERLSNPCSMFKELRRSRGAEDAGYS